MERNENKAVSNQPLDPSANPVEKTSAVSDPQTATASKKDAIEPEDADLGGDVVTQDTVPSRKSDSENVEAPEDADGLQEEEEEEKKRRKWPLLLLLLLLVAAAIAASVWWYISSQQPTGDGMESNVIVGTMEGMSDEELQKLLNDKLSEGMLGFALNTVIGFETAESPGKIMFENPPNNAKLTKLEIKRDDTGEVLYSTGFLSPGSYVSEDTLDVKLDPGTYKCTAYITSYKEDTKAYIGVAAAALTIAVLG